MSYNPGSTSQPKKVILTWKIQNQYYSPLVFDSKYIEQFAAQTHLGLFLDSRLHFQEYLDNIFKKIKKTIGLIRKFQNILPIPSLITTPLTTHLIDSALITGI